MQKSVHQQIEKLKKNLANYLTKEKSIVDIIIIGSILKGKERPNDIDIIVILRTKDYEKNEDILYGIKKLGDDLTLHVEPIFVDNLFREKIFVPILHEGYSIRNNKFISNIMRLESQIIVKYSLVNKSKSDKVRFSYALYGRKKGEGFLGEILGKELGKGVIQIPVSQIEKIKDFLKLWDVKYKTQRTFFVND